MDDPYRKQRLVGYLVPRISYVNLNETFSNDIVDGVSLNLEEQQKMPSFVG